jgi:DNA-directed RNA polymerase subunit RPC12/RpoP
MGQLIGLSVGGPYVGIIVVVIIVVIAGTVRLYMIRSGYMRAKCSKCGTVFDASRSFSAFHIGPLKQLKCPSCGKTSLMKAYSKDPVTFRSEEISQDQKIEGQLTDEDLEQKRIEDSKYERT